LQEAATTLGKNSTMNNPRQTARHLIEQNAFTLERLWVSYWSQGGSATEFELDAYLYGAKELPEFDLKILAWAIEELQGPRPR
jgi:hypothetical protein